MTKIQETGDKVLANVERVIVGKHHEVRLALVALLCRGHLLIEDVPGTGKTVLAKAIARSLGCSFRRIQFTPDLLPSDVSGLSIYNQKTQEFEFRPGPIFSQVVLADEINRATPKTQSALLECMEERQATIDGTTYPMPDPFLVIATQNPIEYEGTFALPEAQLDRFMIRLRLGYPQPIEEIVILDEQKRTHPLEDLEEVLTVEDLREMQAAVREIYVDSTRRRLHRPAGQRHAEPSRRLPRRVAARLDRALPRRPGAGRAARPRLRHPGRHQGARRAGPGPPADHQDELVDPRRAGRPGRPRAARVDPDRRDPADRRRSDRAAHRRCAQRRRARAPRPSIGPSETEPADDPQARAAHRRRGPRRRRVLDRAAVPVLPALPGDPRHRRLVRPGPARADRPRGRLRGEPAARPRRRPDAGHLHAAQRQPAAEALAGGPQPDDAARRAAGPGDHPRRAERALVAHPRPAGAARPLPDRAAAHPDRRPVRLLRGVGDGRPGRLGRRLSAARAAPALAAARRPARGQHASPVRTLQTTPLATTRPALRPGRQHEPDPLEDARPATARSRSRSSTSSRPPTRGSSSTCSAASRPAAATTRRSRRPSGPPRRSPTRRSRRTGRSG